MRFELGRPISSFITLCPDIKLLCFQLAEKRKTMLDELAIKYQKDCDKHREQMLSQEDNYESKLKTLQQHLDQEQVI